MRTIPFHPAPDDPAARPAASSAGKAHDATEAARDTDLLRRSRDGEESAFAEIVRRHYAWIRALAYRVLRNASDAEEAAQDTFIRAHRALANFRGDCTLTSWLHCIVLNVARSRYGYNTRRGRKETISIDHVLVEDGTFSLADTLPDDTAAPRTEVMTREFVALVADCMNRLEASQREILMMRTKLNLSYEEIAATLGINPGTVKSRIARARECLRDMLHHVAPEFGEESHVHTFFGDNRALPPPRLATACSA